MTTVGNRQYSTLGVGKNGGQKWKQDHLAVCACVCAFTIAEIHYVC